MAKSQFRQEPIGSKENAQLDRLSHQGTPSRQQGKLFWLRRINAEIILS